MKKLFFRQSIDLHDGTAYIDDIGTGIAFVTRLNTEEQWSMALTSIGAYLVALAPLSTDRLLRLKSHQ